MSGVSFNVDGPGIAAFLAAAVAFWAASQVSVAGLGGDADRAVLVLGAVILGYFGYLVERTHTEAHVATKGIELELERTRHK